MPGIDNLDLPNNVRPDLTPYLIHLTKEHSDSSALENLASILKDGVIRGTHRLLGKREAACFIDVPFIALKYICSQHNQGRYEPYGLIVEKTTAYEKGARPVLYLSKHERQMLGITEEKTPDELWRLVTLQGSNRKGAWDVNWMHEREWRSPDEFKLPPMILAVLVRTSEEASRLSRKIAKNPHLYRCRPRSVIPLNVICQGLVY